MRTIGFPGHLCLSAALALFALLGGAAEGRADSRVLDPRWQGWLGCWTPAAELAPAQMAPAPETREVNVCVFPVASSPGVEVVTLVDGKVVQREGLSADETERPSTVAQCTGTERARWSADGYRFYRHAVHHCDGSVQRTTHELSTLTPEGEWLRVQGMQMGPEVAVRSLRYRRTTIPAVLEKEMERVFRDYDSAGHPGRVGFGPSPDEEDVVEALAHLPKEVVADWLVEQTPRLQVDAARLRWLAQHRVPGEIVDLMVALSYPGVFALDAETGNIEREEREREQSGRERVVYVRDWDAWDYGWRSRCSRYSYDPYSYDRYSYDRYGRSCWDRRPVVVVRNPGTVDREGASLREGGRVVKGRGYTRGRDTEGARSRTPERVRNNPTPRSADAPRDRGSQSGATKTENSGSSTTERKARPKGGGSEGGQ